VAGDFGVSRRLAQRWDEQFRPAVHEDVFPVEWNSSL